MVKNLLHFAARDHRLLAFLLSKSTKGIKNAFAATLLGDPLSDLPAKRDKPRPSDFKQHPVFNAAFIQRVPH